LNHPILRKAQIDRHPRDQIACIPDYNQISAVFVAKFHCAGKSSLSLSLPLSPEECVALPIFGRDSDSDSESLSYTEVAEAAGPFPLLG